MNAVAIAPVEEPPRPEPFVYLHADGVGEVSEAADFVEDLLTEGGASVVYGPSNCGKTFWIMDLGAHVATGKNWRYEEHEVEQGAVVYFALEGTIGARNRVNALLREGILTAGAPFYLCFDSVSLLEGTHAGRFNETIRKVETESGFPVRLVILDTLARAMAGGDENAGTRDSRALVHPSGSHRVGTRQ